MEKEFLQKVNLDMLKSELNLDISGISELLDVSTQTIYKWNRDKDKGGCRPTYDTILVLLQKGASLTSIFGISNYNSPNNGDCKKITDEEFLAGVREALKNLASN